MGVVVRRDDGYRTTVKGNDDNRLSSDGMMLWLGMRKNRDAVK
jgi:hypothetical protein